VDTILQSFVSALIAGFAVLHVYTLPILGVAAHLAWLRGVYPSIRAGLHPGELWAQVLLMAMSIAGYIYLLTHFQPLARGVFVFATELGAQVGGFSGAAMMQPSQVFQSGAAAGTPLIDFMARFQGWAALKNFPILLQYSLAYTAILIAFIGIAINISLTIIEFHFAVLAASVLLPWAPLGPTAFLAEFSLGWCVGMAVRMLIQTAVVGLSVPLFEILVASTTAGGDPDLWGALRVVAGAMLFFVLSWVIPNRAVGLCARGLAIAGSDVLAGLASAGRGVRGFAHAGRAVVSGMSRMMTQERARA
jgi:type IV secretion system protein TrbL